MTNTKFTASFETKPIEQYRKRELEKMVRMADKEIAEWRGFSTAVKKEIRRRNLIESKKNAAKESV